MSKPIVTAEQCREWFTTIEEDAVNLSAWEESFVASTRQSMDAWGQNWQPSDRVKEIIERIYTERVP